MRNILLLTVSAAALCGCANRLDAPLSPTFGQAFASMQAQVIPAPVSTLPPEDSGVRATAALTRLEKDQVKKLEVPSTSALNSSGSYSASR